jgi:hypothetical protein
VPESYDIEETVSTARRFKSFRFNGLVYIGSNAYISCLLHGRPQLTRNAEYASRIASARIPSSKHDLGGAPPTSESPSLPMSRPLYRPPGPRPKGEVVSRRFSWSCFYPWAFLIVPLTLYQREYMAPVEISQCMLIYISMHITIYQTNDFHSASFSRLFSFDVERSCSLSATELPRDAHLWHVQTYYVRDIPD